MLLVITGNEKAGKSTLARRIDESRPQGLHVVHAHFRWWEGFSPQVYARTIELATRPDVLVVMDRCWADEPHYNRLLGRRQTWSELEGEWCFGMAARAFGAMFVLPNQLVSRDESDYTIDPEVESAAWRSFAEFRPWWTVFEVPPEPEQAVSAARWAYNHRGGLPPVYSGAAEPKIVLVGQERNVDSKDPMAWAPLSTRTTRQLSHVVPVDAWPHLGLTNAADLADDAYLRTVVKEAELVVALGAKTAQVMADNDMPYSLVVPHPSAVYRWGRYQGREDEVYGQMVQDMLRVVEGPADRLEVAAQVGGGRGYE